MAAQSLKLLGKEFILPPKREYDQMQAALEHQAAQDRGDVAEAKRRAKEPAISSKELHQRVAL